MCPIWTTMRKFIGSNPYFHFIDRTCRSRALTGSLIGILFISFLSETEMTLLSSSRIASLQVSELFFENDAPTSYWEKTYAAKNDQSDLSCEIIRKGN